MAEKAIRPPKCPDCKGECAYRSYSGATRGLPQGWYCPNVLCTREKVVKRG